MKVVRYFILISALCAIVFSEVDTGNAQSGTGTGWSPDARVPGYLDDTFTPFLLADRNGTVHAFANQLIAGIGVEAVVYRQWSLKGGWTRPVDILLAPTGDATVLGAYLDESGILHVIFAGQGEFGGDAIYYSRAPVASADLAKSWSPPVIVGENAIGFASISASAAITGDEQNNLFIAYCGDRDGPGVYLVKSSNGGENWTEPSSVFLTYNDDVLPNTLRLVMGAAGQVHATWNVTNPADIDEALYFASYNISNTEWSSLLELDRRIDLPDFWGPAYPAMVDNGEDIVILYNGGNPYADQYAGQGRPVMRAIVSNDGGLTWNGPSSPFPLLNGESGEHALVVDSEGVIHGLFVMRIDQLIKGEYTSVGGIWHSEFDGQVWSVPERFVPTLLPSNVRAVISQGNILLVVWIEDFGDGQSGVWYTDKVLDAPSLPIEPSPDPTVALINPTSSVESLPDITSPVAPPPVLRNASSSNNPTLPLIVGLISIIFLIMIVLFVNLRRNRSQS